MASVENITVHLANKIIMPATSFLCRICSIGMRKSAPQKLSSISQYNRIII